MKVREIRSVTFANYQEYLSSKLGIRFTPEKSQMLKNKLVKLMARYGVESYEDFFEKLRKEENSQFWHDFVHEITTHKTDFFRENNHFEFIKKNIPELMILIPKIRIKNEITIWSAGCSTGEEPYTLSIVLKEYFPELYVRILATDLSQEAVAVAVRGLYPFTIKSEMNPIFISKYFIKKNEGFLLKEEVKKTITFRHFNLMKPFPFKKKFQIIFCRNVMIYFSNQTIEELLQKFYDALDPGGLLFIGHSESLINKKNPFRYIQPTIYQK